MIIYLGIGEIILDITATEMYVLISVFVFFLFILIFPSLWTTFYWHCKTRGFYNEDSVSDKDRRQNT